MNRGPTRALLHKLARKHGLKVGRLMLFTKHATAAMIDPRPMPPLSARLTRPEQGTGRRGLLLLYHHVKHVMS